MIALDTNILLRLLLADDLHQLAKARRELATVRDAAAGVFINDIVLAEGFWTLRGSYGYSKDDVLLVLRELLNSAAFAFERRPVLQAACAMYEASAADFADCLIVAKNGAIGCKYTATFDRAMRGLLGAKVL